MKNSGITNKSVLALKVAKSIYNDSWQCVGCGEIVADCYFENPLTGEREYAYEIEGSNGNGSAWANSDTVWVENDTPKRYRFGLNFVNSLTRGQYLALASYYRKQELRIQAYKLVRKDR